MKKFLLLCCMLYGAATLAQITRVNVPHPISSNAYDDKVYKDLNFIVLGSNNLSEGFSVELNEAKTELNFSGKLFRSKIDNGVLVAEATLATDNGKHYFNFHEGANTAEASISFFWPHAPANGSKYNSSSEKDQRIFLRTFEHRSKLSLLTAINDSIAQYEFILQVARIKKVSGQASFIETALPGIPPAAADLVEVRSILSNYLPQGDPLLGLTLAELWSLQLSDTGTFGPVTQITHGGQTMGYLVEKLSVEKLIVDYDKLITRRDNHADTLTDGEINAAQEIWTRRTLGYWGIFVNYEHESFSTYSPSGTFAKFDDLFRNRNGNLLEAGLNFNYLYQQADFFFYWRASAAIGKYSNFGDFDKSEIEYAVPAGSEDAAGNPVTMTDSKTVYSNPDGQAYRFAFGYKPETELYLGHSTVGIYGKIGYLNGFNPKDVLSQSMPFETGVYINVDSDEESIASILLFINREDLFASARDSTNFGIKVGLPFEFSKKL